MVNSAIVAALAGFAAAAPFDLTDRANIQSQFSIEQVAVPRTKTLNPAAVYQNALAKYKFSVPEDVAAAAQTGAVTATPETDDEAYLCPVAIGTPAQTLNMDFDTGSADLWVFSSELPASERSGHTIYTPSKSSTSKVESGETWDIEYADGSGASGNVYSDKVVIGGVTATSQAVEAATSVSSTFVSDTANNGLVGLAMSSINTASPNQVTTFFDTVKSSLASPLFAAALKKGAAGAYDFGYTDSSKYTGSIRYVNVNTANGFWQFTAGATTVGSTAGSSIGSAIADTGTTLLLIPQKEVAAYYSKVSGATYSSSQGGYIFPCSATLPNWSVVIGSGTSTVPGSYMNYAAIGNGDCYGGIQSNQGESFSIFGDIFLKSQYVVFSGNGPQLGFAQSSSA